jgi:hypothetical protein
MRKQEMERLTALTALGRQAWENKVGLTAFADLQKELAELDGRVAAASQTASALQQERTALEAHKREALDEFSAQRNAVEIRKQPVDAALRTTRAAKVAAESSIKQSQARLATIAGKLAERTPEAAQLVAEQPRLTATIAEASDKLRQHGSEEARLASESQALAGEMATIDAERTAVVGKMDATLGRLREELQGASQQAGTARKDRDAVLCRLGLGLYEAQPREPSLAEPIEQVAAVDRARATANAALAASMAETASLPKGTMAKFWGAALAVPLLLAIAFVAANRHTERPAPYPSGIRIPIVAAKPPGGCKAQPPPDEGQGVALFSDCTRSEGTFVGGQLHGKGKKVWKSGETMDGEFYGGLLNGAGVHVYRDGRRFEGQFVDGRPYGPCKLTMPDGTVYTGNFWGTRIVGWAVRRSPNGEVLAGDWRPGQGREMKPFGLMLRVRPDGTREKIDAAVLDQPAGAPVTKPSQPEQTSDDSRAY